MWACRQLLQTRIGHSQEFSEFQCETAECYLCNKSTCECSSQLNISPSDVSGCVTKWLGTTATKGTSNYRSGLVHKVDNFLQSITTDLQISWMWFHSRVAACKTYISSCNAKCPMQWYKAHRHWTLEMCSLDWQITLLCLVIQWTDLGLAVATRAELVWSLVEWGIMVWKCVEAPLVPLLVDPLSSSEKNS